MLKVLCITFCMGILCGLSLLQAEKVLFQSKKIIFRIIISLARFFCLAIFFYIMLKSYQIHPIILLVAFLSAYWLTILKFKEFMHARS